MFRRLILLVLLVCGAYVVSVPLRIWHTAGQDNRRESDAIVVLGAAQYNGVPSPALAARLGHAADLYEQGVADRIVTVGGAAPGDTFTEGGAGREYLATAGIPDDALIALETGHNTQTSLQALAELFTERGWSSTTVVTDPWHTFRSIALADAEGIDAVGSPVRGGPGESGLDVELRYVARESAAFLQWRLTGDTGAGGPDAF